MDAKITNPVSRATRRYFVEFAPDPVRLAIGSFLKVGASQVGCASEALGAALFGRICNLHTTSMASMRSGQRWQERVAGCAPAGCLAPYTLHDTLFQYFRGKSAIRSIVDQAVTSLKKTRKDMPWHRNHRPRAQRLTTT